MKKTITIVLCCLLAIAVQAKCSNSGFSFYPSQKEIAPDAMFVIEGYYKSQEFIRKLKKSPVYLVSMQGDTLSMQVLQILKGTRNVSQVLLKPETALLPNTTYYLHYKDEETGKLMAFTKFNYDLRKPEKIHWITSLRVAPLPQPPTATLAFKETTYHQYGCGPAVYAHITVTAATNAYYYKVVVTHQTAQQKQTYYITAKDHELRIGRGMCGGAFDFVPNATYSATITPIAMNGTAGTPQKAITFDSPYVFPKG